MRLKGRAFGTRVARGSELVLGRVLFARAARRFWLASRLDGPNDIERNGEAALQRAVSRSSEPQRPLVIVDVGAHFGEWSTSFLEGVGAERRVQLYAFEPAPQSFAKLDRNLAGWRMRWDDVMPIPSALSVAGEPMTLYVREGDAGSTSVYESRSGTEAAHVVPSTTIDSFAEERGLGEITFLKTDAEGHDFPVLMGGREMFEAARIGLVQFEYNWRWVDARHYLKDVFDYLMPMGYTLGKVTRRGIELYRGWDPELETFIEGNYVGLRGDWVAKLKTFPWWKELD